MTQHVPQASEIVGPFMAQALPWLEGCSTLQAVVAADELKRPLADWRLQALALAKAGHTGQAEQLARRHIAALGLADQKAMLHTLQRAMAQAAAA